MINRFFTKTISLFFLGLAGCASGPAPSLYLLDSSDFTPSIVTSEKRVGFAEVTLPSYARQEKIVSLTSQYKVFKDDDHRWATPPSESVSSFMAWALEQDLQTVVVVRPYPQSLDPEFSVRVAFDRFLMDTDGSSILSGQFLISNDIKILVIERFKLSTPSQSKTYEGYADAVRDGLREISLRMSSRLKDLEAQAY